MHNKNNRNYKSVIDRQAELISRNTGVSRENALVLALVKRSKLERKLGFFFYQGKRG